jgi:hypothetical protein
MATTPAIATSTIAVVIRLMTSTSTGLPSLGGPFPDPGSSIHGRDEARMKSARSRHEEARWRVRATGGSDTVLRRIPHGALTTLGEIGHTMGG